MNVYLHNNDTSRRLKGGFSLMVMNVGKEFGAMNGGRLTEWNGCEVG